MKRIHLKILIVASVLSLACTTKVSEWVLLNAPANQYSLIYFYNGQLLETARTQNATIAKEIRPANIEFRSIEKNDIAQPYYELYYGSRFFARYNDPKELIGLTASPLREKIASEIMTGKLCVLTYLATGNKDKDEKGMQIIRKALDGSPFKNIINVV